ncbi:thioesterase [Spirochaetia bacterium]|nr:thioesterase [Spirochaetia bacterium]GHU34539.1 thioesterase [Spirochaetia bacterium]
MDIAIGARGEKSVLVTLKNTASALGSGGLDIFATPSLIALMEEACVVALEGCIPAGSSSVGGSVEIRHIAPSPLGATVTAVGELIGINKNRLSFRVEAYDAAGKVGEGTHTRFIIDNALFLVKAQSRKT